MFEVLRSVVRGSTHTVVCRERNSVLVRSLRCAKRVAQVLPPAARWTSTQAKCVFLEGTSPLKAPDMLFDSWVKHLRRSRGTTRKFCPLYPSHSSGRLRGSNISDTENPGLTLKKAEHVPKEFQRVTQRSQDPQFAPLQINTEPKKRFPLK